MKMIMRLWKISVPVLILLSTKYLIYHLKDNAAFRSVVILIDFKSCRSLTLYLILSEQLTWGFHDQVNILFRLSIVVEGFRSWENLLYKNINISRKLIPIDIIPGMVYQTTGLKKLILVLTAPRRHEYMVVYVSCAPRIMLKSRIIDMGYVFSIYIKVRNKRCWFLVFYLVG